MAGLNSLISDTTAKTTTMPSWYDQAQQNVVNQATQGANAVPALQNTVAGTAINNLSNSATNPFTQAQGTLGAIGAGATNPWTTNATTGAVSPNTNTAMGGLFAAQDQQLKGLLPSYVAPADAGAIAGGQFGSLRDVSAADTAVTNAQHALTSQQMQAALTNQQTGVNAATGLGNVGAQGTQAMTTLGQAQQASPLTAASGLGKILGGIQAPTTITSSAQLSPLSQMNTLSALLGTNPTNILSSAGQTASGLINSIFNPSTSTGTSSTDMTGGTVPGTMTGAPTDTSGATPGTFPSILGANTSGNTNTSVYSPIDTTGSANMGQINGTGINPNTGDAFTEGSGYTGSTSSTLPNYNGSMIDTTGSPNWLS